MLGINGSQQVNWSEIGQKWPKLGQTISKRSEGFWGKWNEFQISLVSSCSYEHKYVPNVLIIEEAQHTYCICTYL